MRVCNTVRFLFFRRLPEYKHLRLAVETIDLTAVGAIWNDVFLDYRKKGRSPLNPALEVKTEDDKIGHPCPRSFKRDNVFYHVREGELFGDLKSYYLPELFPHSPNRSKMGFVRCEIPSPRSLDAA
jgi:hypothetical protein